MPQPKLNAEQRGVFKALLKFISIPGGDTFVLKGFAGTGKTFLLQYIGRVLQKKKIDFCLLASTGRAAAILRGKTKFTTRTVHSELYFFNKVDGDDDEIPDDAPIDFYGQIKFDFAVRPPDEIKRVYIIDESSMLSSEPVRDAVIVSFGTGILLDDFFNSIGSNKVIFVGDPCQLPPIGQNICPALDLDWLAKKGRTAISMTLSKIERSHADNDILVLADAVRKMAEARSSPARPKMPARNMSSVFLHPTERDLFARFKKRFISEGMDKVVAIARTNVMVDNLNRALRRDIYGGLDLPLQVNDVLMVVQNNYRVPFMNGDFAVVCKIGEQRARANLLFLSVIVKSVLTQEEFEVLLSLDVLYGKASNLNSEQQKALLVDFSRRMRKRKIRPNSREYRDEMMLDPFLNCLRAKYGYAITCHKAQGGEWDFVYLFLDDGVYNMGRPELFQWWYTAITRAKKELHLSDAQWIQ